jgi:hypothetical protein
VGRGVATQDGGVAAREQKGIGVAALEQARGSWYWRARASGAAATACERCKQDVT